MVNDESTIIIFTDAATSPKLMFAVGAYLCLEQKHLDQYAKSAAEKLSSQLADAIVYKQYRSKKSTWSEIKTVIDALHEVINKYGPDLKVEIYTDCQSICDLMHKRKEKLEKNQFLTRSGKILQNKDLYEELFAIANKFQIKFFKLKGHYSGNHPRTLHEKIFNILDKLSRKKLRSILSNFVMKSQ